MRRRPVQRVALKGDDGEPLSMEVALDESPLAWLRRHRNRDGSPLVDDAQFAAGERLRQDFTFGQMMPSVTMNWSSFAEPRRGGRGGAGGAVDLNDAASAARERVGRALSAVEPELAGVLVDVCCFLKGIGEVEKARDWPVRSGKLVLAIALTALARHYGLTAEASGRARGPLVHWGAADYRPRA